MGFTATNYTVSVLLLVVFTIGMMIVRAKKPLENNWPLLYWILIVLIAIRWPDDTWDFRLVLTGAAAGAMLRFEFMNRWFVGVFRFIEIVVQLYMIYLAFVRIAY
jgi:hypothetical protein